MEGGATSAWIAKARMLETPKVFFGLKKTYLEAPIYGLGRVTKKQIDYILGTQVGTRKAHPIVPGRWRGFCSFAFRLWMPPVGLVRVRGGHVQLVRYTSVGYPNLD